MNDRTSSQPKTHVIWDSDGTLDGVIGLMFFLQHPDICVDALTVSCGEAEPDMYAPYLPRTLARLGREPMPVAAGRSTPLAGNNSFPPPWRAAINDFLGIDLPQAGGPVHDLPAADLIVEVLNASTQPVTMFVCGTHTNLAEALRLDPSIKDKIASVQMMGGALYVPGNLAAEWPEIQNEVAEWNIWVDPLAAYETFTAGPPLYLTPLDTTNQVVWTNEDADRWQACGTSEGELAAEILYWYVDFMAYIYPEGAFLWDLVAAVNVTNPELCRAERVHLQVITEIGDQEGRTLVVPGQPANATAYLAPKADEIKRVVAETLALDRAAGSQLPEPLPAGA